MRKKALKTGFTLIELLVVMAIIGVLLALALVSYQGARKSARDGKRKASLEEIRSALEMCRADTGRYPLEEDFSFGESLSCGGTVYMETIPEDPINSSPYLFTYASSDGVTYTLCANQLETTGRSYCLTNP